MKRQILIKHNKAARSATLLAQWDKRRSTGREAVGSNPGRTNTQGFYWNNWGESAN